MKKTIKFNKTIRKASQTSYVITIPKNLIEAGVLRNGCKYQFEVVDELTSDATTKTSNTT